MAATQAIGDTYPQFIFLSAAPFKIRDGQGQLAECKGVYDIPECIKNNKRRIAWVFHQEIQYQGVRRVVVGAACTWINDQVIQAARFVCKASWDREGILQATSHGTGCNGIRADANLNKQGRITIPGEAIQFEWKIGEREGINQHPIHRGRVRAIARISCIEEYFSAVGAIATARTCFEGDRGNLTWGERQAIRCQEIYFFTAGEERIARAHLNISINQAIPKEGVDGERPCICGIFTEQIAVNVQVD